jgi:uncharacterized membrane protein
MTFLISQTVEWLLTPCTSVIRVCILFALSLFSSTSSADEIEELSVMKVNGVYSLRVVSVIDAPADYVYDVITDYKHAYRINPTITEVDILPSDRDGVVRVMNLSEHWVGPFCLKIDWVGDIVEHRDRYLSVHGCCMNQA